MIPPRPQRPPPAPLQRSKLLLVEGATPQHFCEALLRHLGIADEIEIRDFGGVRQFRSAVAAFASSAEFKSQVVSVGVIRDAETDRNAASQSVRDALDAAGLDAANARVHTSIFILPDDQSPGMIETLCVEAIRSDPVLPCVELFFDCARQRGAAVDDALDKRFVQAYLATRQRVQMMPGIASYDGCWPWDSRVFDAVKQFLRSL